MKTDSIRLTIILGLGLCLCLSARPADAFLGLNRKAEPKDLFPHAVNHDLYPSMVIRGGVLARNLAGGWSLGGLPLVMPRAGKGQAPVVGGGMAPGRQAYVMGELQDGALVVRYITVLDADQTMSRGFYYERSIAGRPKPEAGRLPR